LADRTLDLLDRDAGGVFHIGGGVAISWFDYARIIFEEAGLTPELCATNEREYRTAARRPKFSALSNARMESLGLAPMPPLNDVIRAYLKAREQVR
jgi:dTDP-4-dehydrorhamnose reductase